MSALFLRTCFH